LAVRLSAFLADEAVDAVNMLWAAVAYGDRSITCCARCTVLLGGA